MHSKNFADGAFSMWAASVYRCTIVLQHTHKQRVRWPRACRALDTVSDKVECNSFMKGHARPHVTRKQVMRCKLLDDAQPS